MSNLSRPFIDRPIATTLITLAIALIGALAYKLLPIAPLPQVDFPTISVQAALPGASPETMASTIATPLERSLGRISGITEMTSSSTLGQTRITLQFDLSKDINGAAREVQAAINAAAALLPTGLPTHPTYRKVNPADAPIMFLTLTSDSLSQGSVYDAASTILAQKLSQVQGIGQVSVTGSSLPAVRVELNPYLLNQFHINSETVRQAIVNDNANKPKGLIEDSKHAWIIQANDQAQRAINYEPIVVAYNQGTVVHLRDVASVQDSVTDSHQFGSSNGKRSVFVMLYREPNANIIETVQRVRAVLPQLQASIPSAINVQVLADRTPSIRASLSEVERALLMAIGLVILVVYAFLRNGTATLVLSVVMPVSLVGTFAVMYLCGYSLNILTLMALTIATGFVVDDAIVVVENIMHRIESGQTPYEAAVQGAKEISFTVLSISVSLVAVFLPILLMGGMVGRLFREFSVTLAVAVWVSMVVSLTATPMLSARWLRPTAAAKSGWKKVSVKFLDQLLEFYGRTLRVSLKHRRITLCVLLLTIACNVYLYIIVPKGFFPQQNTERITGQLKADQSISFQAMKQKLETVIAIVRKDPDVENVAGFIGGGQTNQGSLIVILKSLDVRKLTADQVIGHLRPKLAHLPGVNIFLVPVQDIRAGGRSSSSQYQYTLQSDNLELLREWEPKIRQNMMSMPGLVDVDTDVQDKGLEVYVNINRDAAARLGVTPMMIDTALNNSFGQRQVSVIYNPLNQYEVVMENAPQYTQQPTALQDIYVITAAGNAVPFSAFASYGLGNVPLAVNHQGQFAASTISFNLPAGQSLGDALLSIDQMMMKIGVPSSIHGSFQGTAKIFQDSLNNQPMLILAALLTVYIVLGILYESLIHPITILSTLPSAGVGTLLALLLFKTEFSVIALIGVILLIGIVKKNAIMMIDFAITAERQQGLPPEEAIYQACLRRFRPILMTTLTALLSALPLAFGSGDGAEFRQPLGISIVGGLLLSQLLTLYTTPVVYIYLDRFRLWLTHAISSPKNKKG